MPPLRIGLIGAGTIGEIHARAARAAGGEIVSVLTSTPESTARAAAALQIAGAASVDALLEQVDLVHVCTPNATHVSLVQAALAAGKHVICEKPLAVNADDAEALRTSATQAGVVAVVPFVYRFYATVRSMRERVRSGAVGAVRLLHGSYLQDWLADPADSDWRVDAAAGGPSRAFADIGVHWFDLAEFVTGSRVTRLVATLPRFHAERAGRPVGTEDAAIVLFETEDGGSGSVVVSQVSHGRKNRLLLSVDADRTALQFDQQLPEHLWEGDPAGTRLIARGGTALANPYSYLPAGHPQGYQDAFDALVADAYAAVLTGGPVDGLPTFADGVRGARITDAVLRSASEGGWTAVTA